MKIIFMGASEFGFECLKKLIEMRENVIAIYTLPNIFKLAWSQSPVEFTAYKKFQNLALKNKIPLIEVTEKMMNYTKSIKSFNPDFILVAGWYHIIPKAILDVPRLGCAGTHASLLPKYRGGAPLTWAIINGEVETGISFFYIAEGIDNGDIIAQKTFLIDKKDNIKTVYQKTKKVTLKILEEYIPLIKKNKSPRIKQDQSQSTYFPPRKPEDGLINWNKTSWRIYNWIRAQTKPYPGAFFFDEKGKKIKVWSVQMPTKLKKINQKPGTILSRDKKKIKIVTSDGLLIINDYTINK